VQRREDRRAADNPLAHLAGGNAKADRRHDRMPLTAGEVRSIIAAALASGEVFRGLTGQDRAALYATAAGTGFRAAELSSLTPEAFELVATPPTVTLAAGDAKNRTTAVQPLPPALAAVLGGYLAGKPAGCPVWPGTWAERAAVMFRIDLEAAGIAYAVDGQDGPEYADFHSLRHTFLTLGGRSGIDMRTLQELAGHSDPKLTARYTHRRLHDLAGAVDKLPNLVPNDRESMPLRLTGTDNSAVVPAVVTGHIPRHFPASNGTLRIVGATPDDVQQTLENRPIGTHSHQTAAVDMDEGAGTRTQDQRIKSPLLYQLSYASFLPRFLVFSSCPLPV
jgi:Phage integrase family